MKYHTFVSFIKSGVRIFGYICIGYLVPMSLVGIFFLVVAEILGIIEEFKP